jgi:hypothetical protein
MALVRKCLPASGQGAQPQSWTGKLRAGGDLRDALGGTARHPERERFRSRLRSVPSGSAWAPPRPPPTEIIDKLNKEINAALADPKIKARLADLGGTVLPGSPADFGKLIADDREVGQGDPGG